MVPRDPRLPAVPSHSSAGRRAKIANCVTLSTQPHSALALCCRPAVALGLWCRTVAKSDPGKPDKIKPLGGGVKHDARGNAVWQWATETARHAVASTSQLLRRLDVSSLSLEELNEDEHVPKDVEVAGQGANYPPRRARQGRRSAIQGARLQPLRRRCDCARRDTEETAARASQARKRALVAAPVSTPLTTRIASPPCTRHPSEICASCSTSCWAWRALTALPRYQEFSSELAASVIDEAARFAQDVLAPINRIGDSSGASFHDGVVQMPAGFRRAYQQYVEGGWTQLAAPAEFGGQGAPLVLAVAVEEIGFGANVAFMLCPLLARGAAEALEAVATPVAAGAAAAEDRLGRVDRHHESHRAAGRFGPGRDPHARRRRRRQLPHQRPEDLHHLRRARPGAQHRAPGTGAHRWRAGRHQGHLAVRGAQIPDQRRWQPRRAQRPALRVDRTQARHPCQPDLRDVVWRSRRRAPVT